MKKSLLGISLAIAFAIATGFAAQSASAAELPTLMHKGQKAVLDSTDKPTIILVLAKNCLRCPVAETSLLASGAQHPNDANFMKMDADEAGMPSSDAPGLLVYKHGLGITFRAPRIQSDAKGIEDLVKLRLQYFAARDKAVAERDAAYRPFFDTLQPYLARFDRLKAESNRATKPDRDRVEELQKTIDNAATDPQVRDAAVAESQTLIAKIGAAEAATDKQLEVITKELTEKTDEPSKKFEQAQRALDLIDHAEEQAMSDARDGSF